MASKRRTKLRTEQRAQQRADELRAMLAAAPVIQPNQTQTTPSVTATVASMPAVVSRPMSPTPASSATPTNSAPAPKKVCVTPLRTVIAAKPYTPAKRVDLGAREREKKTPWWLGPALIATAILVLGLGWLNVQRSGLTKQPVGHPTTTLDSLTREARKKVAFYQKQLGHRLNSRRVAVELTNLRAAPPLDVSNVPRVDRSMMRGVPLMQENYVDQNYGSRNKVEPMSQDHPDARIQYGLQEEQERTEFDRRAEQEYIREFVENARRDGVHVRLDQDSNVIAVEPISGADRRPGAYDSGVAR